MSTAAVKVKIKRAYEPPEPEDGTRVLVDRLWPRGLSKQEARLDQWNRELAPSGELRRWFGHKIGRWHEFSRRYRLELAGHAQALQELRRRAQQGPVTLVYAAKDEQHNHALVLKSVLLDSGNHQKPIPSARTHREGPQAPVAKSDEAGLFQDIPPWIWRMFFHAWAMIFVLFLMVFTTNASATFVVTIAALTGLMILGLPAALAAQSRRSNVSYGNTIHTHTGPLSANAAAAQIVLIPVGGVIGLTAFILFAM